MKIIQVNNFHRVRGGSDVVAELTTTLLEARGHEVILLRRDSRELRGALGKIKAFAAGLFSLSGWLAIKNLLRDFQPDIVHVHELYPLFSPWILLACRQAGVPTVMTCHDFRLICPTAFLFHHDRICERGNARNALWCIRSQCRENFWENLAYALRYWVARRFKLFSNNVTIFVAVSEFSRQKFISHGFSPDKFALIPNPITLQNKREYSPKGLYFAFAGKICREKGADTLIEAARLTKLPVWLAGDYATGQDIIRNIPDNVELLGFLDRKQMEKFCHDAFCLVMPSKWYEMFGLVLLEGMVAGIPVIASNLGGIPGIVADGTSGLLFRPGDAEDLAEKMQFLWENREYARALGQAGREQALEHYSEEVYYQRLLAVYERAIEINGARQPSGRLRV
jgi:glycosyltransferase involved in cell wall biosynthesis